MKNYLFGLWVIWGLVAVLFMQLISRNLEELQAYQWCGFGLFIGLLYVVLLLIPVPLTINKFSHVGILLLVLFVHFFYWFATPIKEDDYFRYSWDGRNSRLGEHPYLNAPQHYFSSEIPAYAKSINNPHLKTIYSPIAQILFLSEGLAPDTIYGWWILILFADVGMVTFTWVLLVKKKIHWHYFAIIWLNPIWLKEGLNSGHIDIFAAIFIWLAVIFSLRNSTYGKYISAIFAAISAGIKPYLCVLILYLMNRKMIKSLIIFLIILLLPWVIFLSFSDAPPLKDAFSSWFVFVEKWDFNSLFYDFFYRVNKKLNNQDFAARILAWVCGFMALGIVYWKSRHKSDTFFWGNLAVVAWLLFQPTANAWYFLPCIGASGAYLLLNNLHEKYYKGVLAACAIALPMSYLHYLDLNYNFLDFKWAMGELLLMILTFLLFILPKNQLEIKLKSLSSPRPPR